MRILVVIALFFFLACNTSVKRDGSYIELIGKPCLPIHLEGNETNINTDEYILETNALDSITVEGKGYTATLDKSKKSIVIIAPQLASALGVLNFWVGGISNSVLLKRSNKQSVELSYKNEGKVQLKGEMNAWNILANSGRVLDDKRVFNFNLNPGRYQYQFVVNGQETLDPTNSIQVDNGMGGYNSLLEIERPVYNSLPHLKTQSFKGSEIFLELTKDADQIFVFCENQLLTSWINVPSGQVQINVPSWAGRVKRTLLRAWAYNNSGAGEELMIPLEYGKPVVSPNELNRKDWHAAIMYFPLIDRFNNGNTNNDRPTPDEDILPKANHFGGDLEGIEQSIQDEYFQELGINTLWLSPITLNPDDAWGLYPTPRTKFSGYHGYWPISNTKVDYRFGNKDNLDNLIDEAHDENMNVILDYVANHVHKDNPIYQQHKDWATDLYLPDGSLNTEKWDEHRLTTWFDTFLPTLDLAKVEVCEAMTDTAMYWVRDADLDGFRHDATKHIPEIFWKTLTKKIKKEISGTDRTIFQIGETYGSRELNNSYINNGQLDAQFDFNIYDDAISVFGRPEIGMTRLINGLTESFSYYGNHHLMGNISGNQDKPRFISLASGAIKFDEDSKYAGWNRDIQNNDPLAFKKLSQLHAFIMTIPGIPCVYYGDEYGSPGGNDPDNRRMMKFPNELDSLEKKTFEQAKKIIGFRRDHLALTYGDFEFVESDDEILIYKRSYFKDVIYVAFNKSNQERQITIDNENDLKSNFEGKIAKFKSHLSLTLPPNSFEILTSIN